jgi:hypothetical protein
MDMDTLMKALENDDHAHLLNLTTTKIKKMKLEILKELGLTRAELLEMMEKLKTYRYVDGMNELRNGAFLRWIPIKDDGKGLELKKGGLFCNFRVCDEGTFVVCKSYYHKYFQFKMDECLLFQKLSDQEQVLLCAMDYLHVK